MNNEELTQPVLPPDEYKRKYGNGEPVPIKKTTQQVELEKQRLSNQLYCIYMAAYSFTRSEHVTAKQVQAYNDFVDKLDQIWELDLYDFYLVDECTKLTVESGIEEEAYFSYIADGHKLIDNAYREYRGWTIDNS